MTHVTNVKKRKGKQKMNTRLLTVTSTGSERSGIHASVAMSGNWLSEIGFTVGERVQAIPLVDGMDFFLCNNETINNEAVKNAVINDKGKRLRVISKGRKYPTLIATGSLIGDGGLHVGDLCVVRHQYATIRLRRLRLTDFGFNDNQHTQVWCFGKYGKNRINGKWMYRYGFEKGALLSVTAEDGSITIERTNESVGECDDANMEDYARLVKMARKKLLALIQVGENKKSNPYVDIPQMLFRRAGFLKDDVVVIHCGEQLIQIYKLDVTTIFST
jgi:hypothetical protein